MLTEISFTGKNGPQTWNTHYNLDVFWDFVAPNFPYPFTIYCVYQIANDFNSYYACVVEEYKIFMDCTDPEVSATTNMYAIVQEEIFGIHKFGKKDSEVLEIDIKHSDTTIFPSSISKKFTNLKVLRIKAMIKVLSYENIRNFADLEELYLSQNNLKTIASDTFIFNKKLRIINLEGNPMKTVGNAAFWFPQNLTYLDTRSYLCLQFQAKTREEIEKLVIEQRNSNCSYHDALLCKYQVQAVSFIGKVYTCWGNNTDVKNSTYALPLNDVAFGEHMKGYSNDQVEAVKIINYQLAPMFKFQFSKNFPNLKYIQIFNSSVKQLFDVNFGNLTELMVIDLSYNIIGDIHQNYFKDNHNLVSVNFEGNLLTFIPPDIFIDSSNLKFANFDDNKCIKINAKGTAEIRELKKIFQKKCRRY